VLFTPFGDPEFHRADLAILSSHHRSSFMHKTSAQPSLPSRWRPFTSLNYLLNPLDYDESKSSGTRVPRPS
jgi:hypothetical protein